MQQKEFTVRELIEDPSFQRTVRGIATPEEVENWNRWIEASDKNRAIAKTALSDIVGFSFKSPVLPDVEKQWSRLYQKTSGKHGLYKSHQQKKSSIKEGVLRWIFRAVAVFLIVGLTSTGVFYFSDGQDSVAHLKHVIEKKTIITLADEQKTLSFSNGARIVLNSNSTLTYTLGVLHAQPIEVTLEGEAWFETAGGFDKEQPAFAIRTPDGIIRDIGTKFLVTIQEKKSRVVLQEGIVEVEPMNRAPNAQDKISGFRIKKGEMVEFNRKNILKREQINPTLYTSWATGFMEFDQTGLEEFSQYVRDQFGVRVQLNDSDLMDITLDGTVYFRSLDELVRSVSEVTGIAVYRSADKQAVFIGSVE